MRNLIKLPKKCRQGGTVVAVVVAAVHVAAVNVADVAAAVATDALK